MNKGALLLITGRCAQALLTVAALRILTSLLSPAQVGSVYLMLSFVAWFSLFLINPVGMYINRKIHGWRNAGVLWERFRIFNLYVVTVSALGLPLVFSAKVFFGIGADIPLYHFIVVVVLYVYSVTWNQTTVPALNMLGRRGAFVGFSVLTTALGLLFSVVISKLAGGTASSWLYGQALAMLVVHGLASSILKNTVGPPGNAGYKPLTRTNLAPLWLFAGPLSVATFFMWAQTQSYRLIVEKFIGAEFLGYLVVGLGIASSLAGIAESLVQQLYYPEFYSKLHNTSLLKRREALSFLAARAIPVYIILAVFILTMSQHLTRLLVNAKFTIVWQFTAIGAGIEFFRMVSNIFSAAAHAELKTSALIKPYFWGGSITALSILTVCVLHGPGMAIPGCMAAGGLLTLLLIRKGMKELSDFHINKGPIMKGMVYSLGFIPAMVIGRQDNLVMAILVVALFGTYFLFVQWRLMLLLKLKGTPVSTDETVEQDAASFKAEA